jgi:hypothetical protein
MKKKNLITIVNERLTEFSSDQNPYGWWVNISTGKTLDISSDGGGGDHLGYLWLTNPQNGSKFGLTSFDMKILASEYRDGISNIELQEVQAKIYANWIRVAYWDKQSSVMPGGSLMITVADRSNKSYQAVVNFLISFIDEQEVTAIWVDTYDNQPIWGAITPNQAIMTRDFSSDVLYGTNETIDPQLIATAMIDHYGSASPEQAGWLLPDGCLVNMGRDEDQYEDETYFVTHSESIWEISQRFRELDEDYRNLDIFDLQAEGFIRCYGLNGIELVKQPTPKQITTLRTMIRQTFKEDKTFFVDVSNGRKIVDYTKYDPQSWNVASVMDRLLQYDYPVK